MCNREFSSNTFKRSLGVVWLLASLCAVIFYFLLIGPCCGVSANSQGIYFDDSDPDIMVVGNGAYYEIGFRKSNGAIAYITDKSTGQQVTLGSRYECLWGAVFPQGSPQYVGGCNYNANSPNRFSYAWSAATGALTLRYVPDPAASQQVTAQVVIVASEEPWFDLQLQLQNDWGYVLDYVLFPSDLVFLEADIEEALLPILPGIVLEPAFFEQNRSYTANYPGYPGVFADYVALSSTKGSIAIYSLYHQGPIRPSVIGFIHDEEYVSDSTFYYHTFGARITDGDTWTTPWVRVRISEPPLETMRAYRVDNGLQRFRSLKEKLGPQYTHVVQSPLFKADAVQLAMPFSQYPELLSRVPDPGILHPVAYQPGGHDENYPDFLPPDPTWGTTADFAAMFQQAQARGLLVMPYTNPTWWDDESPTLRNLPPPLTIADIAVLDDQGAPVREYYDSHAGYVVSPWAPFVKQRLDQLVAQMTEDIPGDMLFEDQIGARPWLFDHNSSSPDPMAYIEGWLQHTRAYSDTLLMTELGFDRLAETEVGFHGSVLLPERFGNTAGWWGADTWHPYPLALIMVRDKVLFYQHDLAPETMTVDKATLTWNLAFGYMLSYDLFESSYGGGVDSDWLRLVGAFQKHVLARYADEVVVDFTNPEDNVTRTLFETYTVVANWDRTNTYTSGEHTLPAPGVMVTGANGTLTAGVFAGYNGVPLSAGDHFLIENRGPTDIIVRQPSGADTHLTLELLPGWDPSDPIEVWAFEETDQVIGRAPVTVTSQGATFVYRQQIAGQLVAYYKVVRPNNVFLPLVLNRYSRLAPGVSETDRAVLPADMRKAQAAERLHLASPALAEETRCR
jgi:hypothetical protein